ncbi:MAG: SDR family oxidoreductase [Rhodocyclaceae bacterium]|nr:MAG: SDR family oxidoreductase [Rhodocyclaceae bacterium]
MTSSQGQLAGKVAIVTGAASGFGAAIARAFAEEGARVCVADVDENNGKIVAHAIGGIFIRCDVSIDGDVRIAVEQCLDQLGQLDIVVNNAGTTHANMPAHDVTGEEFDRVFQVNVKGLFHINRHATPAFMRQGGGVFINIASATALRPGPGLCWYGASKGAVISATKGLALELAQYNIRACVINPMLGTTPMLERFMGVPDSHEGRQKFLARIPLGRLTSAEDVALAAVFLSSDAASYITGATLDVDGGRNI